jgi:uncharacterized membrane protein (UPF0127 family)
MRFTIILCGFLLFLGAAIAQDTTTLQIEGTEGTLHKFTVEVANTPELIERGLMERDSLAPMSGMLFDYGDAQIATMWMKNTPLSLDMIFISSSGHIVAIARNAVPQSERKISPDVPVKAVLEISGGESQLLNIQPGLIVHHELFGTEISASPQAEE